MVGHESSAHGIAIRLLSLDEIPEANLRKLLKGSFTTFDIPEVIDVNKVWQRTYLRKREVI